MPSLLYIGQNPAQGTGSPVVILRHLRRFSADGWEIRVVADYGGDCSAFIDFGWKVISLLSRRPWWPPYMDGIRLSRWVRLRLLAREVVNAQVTAPDVILSYLASHTDFASAIAGHYARVSGRPLHVLVHDDAASFPIANSRIAKLQRNQSATLVPAAAVWFVSEELASSYPSVTSTKRRVLLPLPERRGVAAKWHQGRAALRVYYSGHVWPEQVSLLEKCALAIASIGGQLVVIANHNSQLQEAASRAPIELKPLFPTNDVALEHLRQNAAASIVSYSEKVSVMPWSRTSFPSKLLEYANIGLPLALVAPVNTAAQQWSRRMGFAPTFQPNEISRMCLWLAQLRNHEAWQTASEASLSLSRGSADPDRIHGELDSAFRRHILTRFDTRYIKNRLSFQ